MAYMDIPRITVPDQFNIQAIWGKMLRHSHMSTPTMPIGHGITLSRLIRFCCRCLFTVRINASLERKYVLGEIALVALLVMLLGETRDARIQVVVAVAFAT